MKNYFGTTRAALDDLSVEVNIGERMESLVESSLKIAVKRKLGVDKERKGLVNFVKRVTRAGYLFTPRGRRSG